jgi:hypothetical protein
MILLLLLLQDWTMIDHSRAVTIEEIICTNLNRVRTSVGSQSMQLDAGLCERCSTFARQLAATNSFNHSTNRPPGVGEAIMLSTRGLPDITSPQAPLHREEALEKRWTKLGVGYARSSNGFTYWVLQYKE